MQKPAPSPYELHPLIRERWSPRAFSSRPVESAKVCTLLEAARWAPSCFNEQPWRFFVGSQDTAPEALEALHSLLVPANAWAKQAPVMMLSVAKRHFAYDGSVNRHAQHDVGLAVENLVLQAEALGLATHQMAGFYTDKAYDVLSIPRGLYEPMALIAIGYPGSAESLEEPLKARELSPRERMSLQEIAFGRDFNQAYPLCYS